MDLGSSWRNVSALLRMDISHIGSLHAQRCMERVEDPAQKEEKLQRADAKDVCFIVIVDGFGILDFGMYTLLYSTILYFYACWQKYFVVLQWNIYQKIWYGL